MNKFKGMTFDERTLVYSHSDCSGEPATFEQMKQFYWENSSLCRYMKNPDYWDNLNRKA